MRWGFWELVFIALLVFILFGGASKIAGIMKNLANGIKTFKQEIKDEKPTKKRTVAKKTAKKSK